MKCLILHLVIMCLLLQTMASAQSVGYAANTDNLLTINQYGNIDAYAMPDVTHKKRHSTGYTISTVLLAGGAAAVVADEVILLRNNSDSSPNNTKLSFKNYSICLDAGAAAISSFLLGWYIRRKSERYEYSHPARFSVTGNRNQIGLAYSF